MDVLLISAGLMFAGYSIKNRKQREDNVRQEIRNYEPTGEHIYNYNEVEKSKEKIANIVEERIKESKKPGSNLIVPFSTYSPDSGEMKLDFSDNPVFDGTIIENKGEKKVEEYFHNNMAPAYRVKTNRKYDFLEKVSGLAFKPDKKESEAFTNGPQNVFGTPSNDTSDRVLLSHLQTSINPFKEQRDTPLFVTGSVPFGNQETSVFRESPRDIDDLRIKGKERLTFKARKEIGNVADLLGGTDYTFIMKKNETEFKNDESLGFVGSSHASKEKIISDYVDNNVEKTTEGQIKNPEYYISKETINPKSLRETSVNVMFKQGERNLSSQVSKSTKKGELTHLRKDSTFDNNNFLNIQSTNDKNGKYTDMKTFVPKFTIKEYNIRNNYIGQADGIKKDSAYKSINPRKKIREQKTNYFFPGASKMKVDIRKDKEIRSNNKNALVKNYIPETNKSIQLENYHNIGEERNSKKIVSSFNLKKEITDKFTHIDDNKRALDLLKKSRNPVYF